ncbi:MAG: ATP-dependent DNA helicase [Syntrophobacteraceae bacterium]
MYRYFGQDGFLADKIAQFEHRACQMEMAQAVHECLTGEVPLLAEAGTGTGKTWAYLIPSILSGKRVVISTGTKTLQDQILDHDVPLLKKLFFPKLQAVCLKGRKNYLCRRRLRDFSYQPTFWNREEAGLIRRFQRWASRTKTGDRAEITWLPDQFRTWLEVSSNSEQCLGQQCDDHSRCFITTLRMEASHAGLLVVNHHLFFADLALRHKGLKEILPDYDAVIFDEAHLLEDIIGLYFGIEFSNLKMYDLMRDLQRECGKTRKKSENVARIQKAAEHLDPLARLLHHELSQSGRVYGRFTLDMEKVGAGFVQTCRETIHSLEQLIALLAPTPEINPAFESFYRRALELASALQQITEQHDGSLVYWYESAQQSVFLHATPVDIASVLRERLLHKTTSVVLTSATLSVAGSFDFLRYSLGLPSETKEKLLASPFDYEEQALLYVPTQFPAPHEPDFCSRMSDEALEILTRSRGRALVLFTSYRNLNEVYQKLRDRLPYPILVQGQKPKRALLAEFKEKIDSVLFATSSFWQGIDVPGEALSCLLIDKLPFEVPDDPMISARMEHITAQGKSPFFNYQVPRAIIQLKQGVGRLIRSSEDRGLIVIFDVRLQTKGYGKVFMKSLPPCRIVRRIDEIKEFFGSESS